MGSRNNKPARIIKGTAPQPSLKSASGVWTLDEAMQAHRVNAWPQPNLFQPVANSLRLDGSRQTFLSRTISRSGNQQTWTWSGWFKPSTTTGAQYLFVSTNTNGNPFTYVYFSEGVFRWWDGGSVLTTNAVYRDISAWYHVVLAVDTTQATASNRGKLYINGVQVTGFSVSNYPAQGAKTYTNSNAATENIVYISAAPVYVYGYLAEVNFVDGYQLDPSLLGKFDTNNTWVPVPYTGAYGTNGFYLPFTNAATSQTLGYDASLTGTTTYDVDQDPYRGSVALHLTGNGPAGGNNNSFADSSSNNLAITRNGDVTQGSFSPFPFNTNIPYNPATHGASAYFDGSGDYLTAPANSVFGFNADFTVEAWINTTDFGVDTYYRRLFCTGADAATAFQVLFFNGSTGVSEISVYSNTMIITGTIPAANGAWHHIAISRSGTSMKLFIDGVQSGSTATTSQNFSDGTTNGLYIGRYAALAGGHFKGYISNVRVTKGAAIYTSVFTPTMRPFGTLTNNLITFSEDFNNSSIWNKSGTTTIASSAVAPDGNPSATLLAENAGGTVHYMDLYRVYTTGLAHTNSIYVKAAGRSHIMMRFYTDNSVFSGQIVGFNLVTGTVGYTSGSVSASIQNVGNGWYRLVTTVTTGASSTGYIGLYLSDVAVTTTASPSYSGNGTSGVYIWGAQLELASSATNYTPTPANFSTAPSLLLNFANAAVTDTAGTTNLLTASNATITSASKYGSGALTFSGSTDKLQMANSPQFNFGTGDFTVEAWINPTTVNVWQVIFKTSSNSSWTGGVTLALNNGVGSGVRFRVGTAFFDSAKSITPNTWTHVAITRNNASCRIFLNGKLDASLSNIETADAQTTPTVGNETSGSSYPYIGLIDDLRVTKGLARYTTDFTPPARALPEVGGKSFVTTNVNAGVVQRFTTTGTTSWTAPTDVTSVEVLVVAGGGSGGNYHGGGGGAGGLIYNNSYPVTPGQTYTVAVGAGGAAVTVTRGINGSNSQFGNLIAIGGGGGGNEQINRDGASGGSGGGSSYGAGRTIAPGTAGQGFAGGIAPSAGAAYAGAGGGGAGGVGGDTPNTNQGGAGGAGLQFSISGTPTFYAAGGGGSVYNAAGIGIGGSSIGGNGGSFSSSIAATGGATNTGSGGGGGERASGANNSGAGGSGIVVVRYTTTAVGNSSDATTDNLVDSPTLYGHDYGNGGEVVGNYATLNPLVPNRNGSSYTFSNGNLTATNGTGWCIIPATIYTLGGKWYWEYTIHTSPYNILGFVYDNWVGSETSVSHLGYYNPLAGYGYAGHSQSYYYNSTSTAYGALFGAGDIIGVALDMIAGTLTFYKNGASQGTITGIDTTKRFAPAISLYTSSASMNLGQRAWAYAPPAGFNAITTKNLPRPAVGSAAAAPNEYFDAVTWTGTGAAQTITLPGAFQPDLVWTKSRSFENNHHLFDSVRGSTVSLKSNTTAAEDVRSTTLQAFNSNGFSLGSAADVNGSGSTYVAWCWRAGGTAVSNTSGAITSQVSANTASGFSVVTYTGTGTQASVGHGLSAAPELIITKARNQTSGWYTYTTVIDGTMDYFQLNTDAGKGNSGLAVPTSTVFYNDGWSASYNMLAYCFHSVAGYSKIGTYVGNGSADGPFIYTGFKPRFVMVKCSSTAGFRWIIWDTARDPVNFATRGLSPNLAGAEVTAFDADILSNGFKLRDLEGTLNTSGDTYIYMAIADKPFGNVNGVAR